MDLEVRDCLDVYLKWIATAILIIGVGVNSLGIYPLGPILLLLGGLTWLVVSIMWRDAALITTNGTMSLVSTLALIYNFFLL